MSRKFRELSEPARANPRRSARIQQHKQAIADALALAALRESRGATQQELAAELAVTQANVSRIEHEDDVYLSTLSRYVTALGGRLDVRAVFADEVVQLLPRD